MRKLVLLACVAAVLAAAVVFGIRVIRSLPHGQSFYQPIVEGQVYRSSQPSNADWAWMHQHLGIRAVVDLRCQDDEEGDFNPEEGAEIGQAGMKHVHIPMTKLGPNAEDVGRFLDAMADPANRPVLIHCAAGRVRSGMMVAVYRMEFQSWSNQQALDEFFARLSHQDQHKAAEQFIRDYQRRRAPATQPTSRGDAG